MARFEFHPAAADRWDPRPSHPPAGTHVVLSKQSGVGHKPPGGLGAVHRYVEDAETGQFYGMVHVDSLRRVTRKGTAPGPSAGTMPPMFRDRRGVEPPAPEKPAAPHQCPHCSHVAAPANVEIHGKIDPFSGTPKGRPFAQCSGCRQWAWHNPAK